MSGSLTFYVARHTWATLMKKSGRSVSMISEGLGHASEKITQVYLDELSTEHIDKASEDLLK